MSIYNILTIQLVLYEEDFEFVSKCLDQLTNFKVIILDNSRNIKLKDTITKKYKIERYFLPKKNLGYSRGHNFISRYVKTDNILIMNPDCIVNQNSISNLAAVQQKYRDAIIIAPTSYDKNNNLSYSSGLFPENGENGTIPIKINGDICVESVLGFCFLIKLEDFIKLKKFDKNFFLYHSDNDICKKIKKINKSVVQSFESKVIHQHGISKVKNVFKKTYLRDYNFTFDSQYYCYKNKLKKNNLIKLNKKKTLIIKMFTNLIKLNFLKITSYFARYMAIVNFKKKFKNR